MQFLQLLYQTVLNKKKKGYTLNMFIPNPNSFANGIIAIKFNVKTVVSEDFIKVEKAIAIGTNINK